ncbi:MAG: hypothetical protein WCK02_11495 [Bacteroidota bacterium]
MPNKLTQFSLGSYSDRFLPSKDELYQLYLNKIAIGEFCYFDYWCSTQYNISTSGTFVWVLFFLETAILVEVQKIYLYTYEL